MFALRVNDEKSLVTALARILTAPPKLPAWLPLNIESEIIVAIFVYVPAVSEIEPPFDPTPALQPVNVLLLTLTSDEEYDAEYTKLSAPPSVVALHPVNVLPLTETELLLAASK